MTAAATGEPRRRTIALPSRGGAVAALDFGPVERPVDIVFVHANGFNALTYRSLLAPLAERFRILAFDQRGHGLTDLPADPAGRRSWNDLRDDLVAVLDVLKGPPPVVAGHSMGGTVSLLAAALRPERVRELVLFDPVIMPRAATLLAKLPGSAARMMRRLPIAQAALRRRTSFPDRATAFEAYRGRGAFRAWPDPMLADYLVDGLKAGSDGGVTLACAPQWEASNYVAQGHDPWRALRRWPGRTTILRAGRDSTCSLRTGGARLRVETLAGAGHFLPMERPDMALEALAQALERR